MLPLIREGKEAELGEAAGSHRSPASPRRSVRSSQAGSLGSRRPQALLLLPRSW